MCVWAGAIQREPRAIALYGHSKSCTKTHRGPKEAQGPGAPFASRCPLLKAPGPCWKGSPRAAVSTYSTYSLGGPA
eukprot:15175421-Alexandrium_andersonii.AAC.1